MRTLAMQIISNAALAAGLPEGRITDVSAADNLTLVRPRIEVDFLPDSLTRTGRKLAITRAAAVQTTKKELYELRFDLTAHVYAPDEAWLAQARTEGVPGGEALRFASAAAWLEEFENSFVAAFPRGVNDQRGNWIKIRVNQATFKKEPTQRVGTSEITVFTKIDTLFLLTLTGRVTREDAQALLTTFQIVPKIGARE
jgi:hypothetical protein